MTARVKKVPVPLPVSHPVPVLFSAGSETHSGTELALKGFLVKFWGVSRFLTRLFISSATQCYPVLTQCQCHSVPVLVFLALFPTLVTATFTYHRELRWVWLFVVLITTVSYCGIAPGMFKRFFLADRKYLNSVKFHSNIEKPSNRLITIPSGWMIY